MKFMVQSFLPLSTLEFNDRNYYKVAVFNMSTKIPVARRERPRYNDTNQRGDFYAKTITVLTEAALYAVGIFADLAVSVDSCRLRGE